MSPDVVVVGGGLAGASLGKVLAEAGVSVRVLEREVSFKDRVRGEQMTCWGVAEAKALGIYEALVGSCAREVRYWVTQVAGAPPDPLRDLTETCPHRCGTLHFHHPEMQEVVLAACEQAGAEVVRGARVLGVTPGRPPSVRYRHGDTEVSLAPRLVVAADGRSSACRTWAGFETRRDPEGMVIFGVLFEGLGAPEDRTPLFVHPDRGRISITMPLTKGRFRSFAAYHKAGGENRPLSGVKDLPAFIEVNVSAGAPREWYERAEARGPLASFDGADVWVDHPYREGVALIGDAAAATDPSFGCGLSLTVRDVRTLRDHLLAEDDWDAAGHAYAEDHDRYYGALHRILGWMTRLLYDPRPDAAALRQRAMPAIGQDPTRMPDVVGLGPESPSDEAARRRLFAEE